MIVFCIIAFAYGASVVELVDTTDSKSVASDGVLVQVRPEVPNQAAPFLGADFFIFSKRLRWFDFITLKSSKFCELSNF